MLLSVEMVGETSVEELHDLYPSNVFRKPFLHASRESTSSRLIFISNFLGMPSACLLTWYPSCVFHFPCTLAAGEPVSLRDRE